ncbi:MAG TPA: methylated-DNA--[protein]-cysteine S-methyltransferase [Firmicutes bacterium]|nr:methylated-DNA--[protein]-cysteine S-methyltransferase [Bacillota bacterium]
MELLYWQRTKCRPGIIYFSYTAAGLHSLCFPPGPPPDGEGQTRWGNPDREPTWVKDFVKSLQGYFLGEKNDFRSFPVDVGAYPAFSRRVLLKAREIPYGETLSYQALAAAASKPGAARAVGNIMSKNPLPLVIPCHRVINKDGGLGGFKGGLDWKKYLLQLENAGNPCGKKEIT